MKILVLIALLATGCASEQSDMRHDRGKIDDLCIEALNHGDTASLRILDSVRLKMDYWHFN